MFTYFTYVICSFVWCSINTKIIIVFEIFLSSFYRGRFADALKSALKNAPLGSKNQQLRVYLI